MITPCLVLAVAAVGLAACGGAPEARSPASPPPDGEWRLIAGSGPDGAVETVDAHRITLVVEGARIGGVAACNSYGATARIDGERLELEELAQTEMACEPEVMAAERAYTAALQNVDGIRRDGEQLVLTGPSVELTFEAVPPVPTEQLVGTRWELETVVEGETASSAAAPATLRFGADGTLDGHTGCRRFSGGYVVRGGEVRMTQLTMGEPDEECPPEGEAQDRLVVSVLGDGFAAEIVGAELQLGTGHERLVYRVR